MGDGNAFADDLYLLCEGREEQEIGINGSRPIFNWTDVKLLISSSCLFSSLSQKDRNQLKVSM